MVASAATTDPGDDSAAEKIEEQECSCRCADGMAGCSNGAHMANAIICFNDTVVLAGHWIIDCGHGQAAG